MTQQSATREDLRVRRTRKALQNALIELTAERGFADVTVQDIADLAMVNRATFYRYYQDKYDLLDKYMEEQYELLETALRTVTSDGNAPPIGLVRLLEHIQAHPDFFRAMLGDRGDPAFARKIRLYIERRFRAMLAGVPGGGQQASAGGPPLEVCLSYISSASLGVITWWLENGMPYTPAQIAAWSVELSSADLRLMS